MMNILMMGVQGAGKGTQGKRVASHFHLAYICTGDIFRDEYARKTDFGIKAHEYWGSGGLVPDDMTIGMIQDSIRTTAGSVLDGFPRTIRQAEALEAARFTIDHVIELSLPDPVAIDRLSYRRICLCGQEYGLARTPEVAGACDACGKTLVAREDDTPEKIIKRVVEYHAKTKPILNFYALRGIMHRVEAAQHPDKVFEDILGYLMQGPTRAYPAIKPE